MEPGIGDFLGQIPAYFFVVPIILGVAYIAVMVWIFRRSAERRRKNREVKQQQLMMHMGMQPGMMMPQAAMPGFVPMARPAITPLPSQPHVTAPNVPEPDLADLLSDTLLDEADRMGSVPAPAPAPVAYVPIPVAIPTAAPSMEAAMPITPLSSLSSDEVPADAIEVMRIWRDVNDGGLIIQMGNQLYRSASEIQSPDLLRRFTTVVRELGTLISGVVAPAPRGTIQPLPPASPATPQPYATSRPPTNFSFASSEAPKSGGMINRLMGRPTAPPPASNEPAGIAASVEEYLQNRLPASPEFAQRGIHVRPSLDHGIKIELDGRFYDGIDEVPDDSVRDFMFTVMREWEARQ